MLGAGPVLLEPIYEVSVTVPADNMGDILGDMNTRRARVLGMDQEGTKSIVKAEVPLAEMQTYTADLRSMTQGRGVFSHEVFAIRPCTGPLAPAPRRWAGRCKSSTPCRAPGSTPSASTARCSTLYSLRHGVWEAKDRDDDLEQRGAGQVPRRLSAGQHPLPEPDAGAALSGRPRGL
jgi:hypothetical protein